MQAGISNTRLPVFTNINLTSLDLRYTSVRGGAPDGDDTFVIPRDTFKFTTKLSNLYIDSGNFTHYTNTSRCSCGYGILELFLVSFLW